MINIYLGLIALFIGVPLALLWFDWLKKKQLSKIFDAIQMKFGGEIKPASFLSKIEYTFQHRSRNVRVTYDFGERLNRYRSPSCTVIEVGTPIEAVSESGFSTSRILIKKNNIFNRPIGTHNLVTVEHSLFNQEFVVVSSEPDDAMRILSSEVIENLMDPIFKQGFRSLEIVGGTSFKYVPLIRNAEKLEKFIEASLKIVDQTGKI